MNVRRHHISGVAIAAATVLGLGTLSACSSDSAAAGNTEKFDVVASFYPMAFLAEQIGGDHVKVSSLTDPGQEPHDLEISTQQRAQIENADAALYLKGLQPAVDEAIGQSGVGTRIDAATLTKLEDHGNLEEGHAHEGEEEHSEEEEHARDPHVWLDPVKYAEVAKGVGAAFEKADPDHAADYKKNTEALVKKLDALDTEFADGLKNTRSKVFFTNHAAFTYLAERYGLTQEAIALNPESEPSPARIKELRQEAEADGVTTVFYETLVSDKTARTLADDAGLKTDVLDPLEGITDKSEGDDYFEVMQANLAALKTALGAK
ncbi:metal ABC transporter substrate-binding protein [Streptomyces sp. NPDC007808]|uniref:metal ABC transporter substrate-binding protein n=1 Tax=Streptomyces sp. NPDC007808 TaxID=3364779 RepID=UPI00367A845A